MPLVKIKTGTHVRVEIIFTKINLSIKNVINYKFVIFYYDKISNNLCIKTESL